MGGNYIFSGRAPGWTMGVCISAVAHLWAAGVFSTEKRRGKRFSARLRCGTHRPSRAPRRPLRWACLARCPHHKAICCTQQPATGESRSRHFLRPSLAIGFLAGPLRPDLLNQLHNICFSFDSKLLSNSPERFLNLPHGADGCIYGVLLLLADVFLKTAHGCRHLLSFFFRYAYLWLCPSGWVQTRAWCPGKCSLQ